MDFAMDIDKLNLANLVGKVMDRIKEHQTSPKNHISRQKLQNLPNLTPKPYWTFYQTFMPLYHSLKSVRPCLFYESVENDPVRIRTPLIQCGIFHFFDRFPNTHAMCIAKFNETLLPQATILGRNQKRLGSTKCHKFSPIHNNVMPEGEGHCPALFHAPIIASQPSALVMVMATMLQVAAQIFT